MRRIYLVDGGERMDVYRIEWEHSGDFCVYENNELILKVKVKRNEKENKWNKEVYFCMDRLSRLRTIMENIIDIISVVKRL